MTEQEIMLATLQVHDRESALSAVELYKLAGEDLRNHASQLKQYGIIPTSAKTFFVLSETYQLADLENKDVKPPEFIIPGLLPAGLTIFAAPSKTGKSWASIDMCISVAQGKPFWGFPTAQKHVLYLDLESSESRLKSRVEALGGVFPQGITVAHRVPDLDHGLIDMLEIWLKQDQQLKVIIIDTIGRVKGSSRRNEDAYTADTRIYSGLQRLAQDYQCAIICITHTRKGVNIDAYDDPFAAIQGSVGSMAVSDCTWMIVGKRNESEKRFLATGRDINDIDITIAFDSESKRWRLLGNTEYLLEERAKAEYENSPIRKTILELLGNQLYIMRTKPEFFEDVINCTGMTPISPTTLSKDVLRMAGQLLKNDHIRVEQTSPWNGGGRRLKFTKTQD